MPLVAQLADVPELLRVLSFTALGAGSCAAASASSPYPALRPLAPCSTWPPPVLQSPGATPQRSAAASTSRVRAVAPASRRRPYSRATLVLPPVENTFHSGCR